MENEIQPRKSERANMPTETPPKSGRSASRMRYEIEANLIRKKVGDLDEIRAKLGLSRRKICQLLLIDPSAWTRWTTGITPAPPHIYRALEWYLLLSDKDPRALMPIGTWSSTSFEDRFQGLERALRQTRQNRQFWGLVFLLIGLMVGVFLGLALNWSH